MGCDSGLYNGKAQPVPPLSRLRERSPRKKGSQRWGRSSAGMGSPSLQTERQAQRGFPGQGKANRTASGAVAQGVGEEIPHHFPEPFPVAGEREFRQISGQVDLLLFQLELQRSQYLPDQPGKLQRFPMQSCPGFQPGEFQQPSHQLCHAVAFLQYDAEVLLPLLGENVLPEGFGVGAQDGQRGFQLMRRRPGEFPLPRSCPAS